MMGVTIVDWILRDMGTRIRNIATKQVKQDTIYQGKKSCSNRKEIKLFHVTNRRNVTLQLKQYRGKMGKLP